MAADHWRDAVAMLTAALNGDGEGFAVLAAHGGPEAVRTLGAIAAAAMRAWCDAEGVDVPGMLEDLREHLAERWDDDG